MEQKKIKKIQHIILATSILFANFTETKSTNIQQIIVVNVA